MRLCPVPIKRANDYVQTWHRHSGRTAIDGGKWAVAVEHEGIIVGVAIVGNPVNRSLMDGWTAEVLRVCTNHDSPKNACSMLYGACWRAWKAMGGTRMVTYTLQREAGSSLRAVGWEPFKANNVPWNHAKRERKHQDIYLEEKYRWEIGEKCNDEVPQVARLEGQACMDFEVMA